MKRYQKVLAIVGSILVASTAGIIGFVPKTPSDIATISVVETSLPEVVLEEKLDSDTDTISDTDEATDAIVDTESEEDTGINEECSDVIASYDEYNNEDYSYSETQDVYYTEPEVNYYEGSEDGLEYIGNYYLTAYCPCSACCGWSTGITASGTYATEGRTVGCNSLPFGTRLLINGQEYIVEDRGGMASNVIDVFFNTHDAALNFGVRYDVPVYIIND